MASSSSSEPSKRSRLKLLSSHSSYRGLHSLLKCLKELPIDDVRNGRNSFSQDLSSTYGHALTTITVPTTEGPFDWEVAKPNEMLKLYLESPALSEYVVKALHEHGNDPDRPWHLVVYCDELTPGNALKLNNKKKLNAYYVCILELEPWLRSMCEAWIPIGVLRSSRAKTIIGGWTFLMRQLMELLLLGDLGVSHAGVHLQLQGTSRLVFFKVHGFIGDTPALAQIWGSMGCNANVPCFACLNLTRHAANLSAYSACLADTACYDNSNSGPVQRATDQDIWNKYDSLAARVAGEPRKGVRNSHEQSAGLHVVPTGCDSNSSLSDLPIVIV